MVSTFVKQDRKMNECTLIKHKHTKFNGNVHRLPLYALLSVRITRSTNYRLHGQIVTTAINLSVTKCTPLTAAYNSKKKRRFQVNRLYNHSHANTHTKLPTRTYRRCVFPTTVTTRVFITNQQRALRTTLTTQ
jgi:hypothetical protein